jgi:hypothetical protein
VTTFGSLGTLTRTPPKPALMVVDEAHYVKNPDAKRSRAVSRIAAGAERVLFLTGTPMENRIDEFQALVHHLRPEIAAKIGRQHGALGVKAFRGAAAPVYLRRNQQDVLTELPELVQVDEWEEFGREDGAAYRSAVEAGNFMAMRRAAFAVPNPRGSAKLTRLLELAHEAMANGRRSSCSPTSARCSTSWPRPSDPAPTARSPARPRPPSGSAWWTPSPPRPSRWCSSARSRPAGSA